MFKDALQMRCNRLPLTSIFFNYSEIYSYSSLYSLMMYFTVLPAITNARSFNAFLSILSKYLVLDLHFSSKCSVLH